MNLKKNKNITIFTHELYCINSIFSKYFAYGK